MAIEFPSNPVDGQSYDYEQIRYNYVAANNYWRVTTPGTVGPATAAEIDTGTDGQKYVTPLELEGSKYQGAILEKASVADIALGNGDEDYITPKRLSDSGVTDGAMRLFGHNNAFNETERITTNYDYLVGTAGIGGVGNDVREQGFTMTLTVRNNGSSNITLLIQNFGTTKSVATCTSTTNGSIANLILTSIVHPSTSTQRTVVSYVEPGEICNLVVTGVGNGSTEIVGYADWQDCTYSSSSQTFIAH